MVAAAAPAARCRRGRLAGALALFAACPPGAANTVTLFGDLDNAVTGEVASERMKWGGCALANNGAIYAVPAAARSVLRVNTSSGQITRFGDLGRSIRKWSLGVLAADGAVYGIPDAAASVLRIDPASDSATVTSVAVSLGANALPWRGAVLVGGAVYGIPHNVGSFLHIDPASDQVSLHPLGGFSDWGYLWGSGVVGADGAIYGIPSYASSVLRIDPTDKSVTTFGSVGSGYSKWWEGVLVGNSSIYGIPYSATAVLRIDTGSRSATTFGSLSSDIYKWRGGMLAANGIIYGIPFVAPNVLRIDPGSDTVTTFGDLGALNGKWWGGLLAQNGAIYGIPSQANSVLVIDPVCDTASTFGDFGDPNTVLTDKFRCHVLAANGSIFALPHNAHVLLRVDPGPTPTSTTGCTTTTTTAAATTATAAVTTPPPSTSSTTATSTTTSTTETTADTTTTNATAAAALLSPEVGDDVAFGTVIGASAGGAVFVAAAVAASVALCRMTASHSDGDIARKHYVSPTYAIKVAPAPARAAPVSPPDALLRGRLSSDPEPEVSVTALTRWCDEVPKWSCKEDLALNSAIRELVPEIGQVINDVTMKVFEQRYVPAPVWLDYDCKFAIAAYTHDFQTCSKAGHLYHELNAQLRRRGFFERSGARETWGVFMYYMMRGLACLPDWEGECYRGYPDKATVLAEYQIGSHIQWGTFWSALTSLDVAKSTVGGPDSAVIFRISVRSGREIQQYASFPVDGEVLLTPNHRFVVSSAPYERDGYTIVDLFEKDAVIF